MIQGGHSWLLPITIIVLTYVQSTDRFIINAESAEAAEISELALAHSESALQ